MPSGGVVSTSDGEITSAELCVNNYSIKYVDKKFTNISDNSICEKYNKVIYKAGDIVYFDPVNAVNTCDASVYSTYGTASFNPTAVGTCYRWRVIDKEVKFGTTNINIMLDHNLISKVAYSEDGTAKNGPVKAFKDLETATDSWVRVNLLNYTYTDNDGKSGYGKLKCNGGYCYINGNYQLSTKARARLITMEEINKITKNGWKKASKIYYYFSNSDGLKDEYKDYRYNWLVENTLGVAKSKSTTNAYGDENYGYWTLTNDANNENSTWYVNFHGSLMYTVKAIDSIPTLELNNFHTNGARPVIKIKTDLVK